MTSSRASSRTGLALWFSLLAAGCPATPPPDPPGLDCDAVDRPEERFPEECGDAGEPPEEAEE